MTGIEYPTITIGGKEHTLRFSLLAECFLSGFGITLTNLLAPDKTGYLVQRFQLLAAAMADSFPDPAKAPGWAKWAAEVTRSEWPAVDVAITESIKKALEESFRASQKLTPPSPESPA